MAAVLGREGGDESGPPTGLETMPGMEGAQAGKGGVDGPEVVAGPGQLVTLDLARVSRGAGDEAGVVAAGRVEPGDQTRRGVEEPDLGAGADRDPVGPDG